ncbi:hypothetical protein AZL_b00180 (plasmid) [Azospirillum sp. B510]|uniref:hypothetical protein n=1 Tax=Azospirillum sp. (strain B510) TaxID=137722 RepID=UPI0001C4C944|nr:hypothetical protein [Azospirillum sp. B510]BAI74681.1 hypothetical protein AZL_b00180 [Azospirillum sp. B510]
MAVARDPAALVRGTREEAAALKHRIGREDRALYDLIDRSGLASAARPSRKRRLDGGQ